MYFSTEHTFGHVYAITSSVNNGSFNEDICISSGFMLGEMMCGQGMIVMITALSGLFINDHKGMIVVKHCQATASNAYFCSPQKNTVFFWC